VGPAAPAQGGSPGFAENLNDSGSGHFNINMLGNRAGMRNTGLED